MEHYVLGVGYLSSEYEAEEAEWVKHGIIFDFAKDIKDASEKLLKKKYACVVIRAEYIAHEEISYLREVCPISTVILPQSYSVEEALVCAHLSIAQYARTSGHADIAAMESDKSLQEVLNILPEQREALTIITVKDLSFCLEYRSVEIRGVEIALTEKEFDIFALLLTNPKKVFTHEMIMDAVWHEDLSFYSPKTITTHISNLRKKLKTAPDVPEYIKSVRGVGYKFDTPR